MFNYKDEFNQNSKRASIKAEVKKAVFERAKGQCEHPRCHINLKWGSRGKGTIKGVFHHIRTPSISPTEKTVRFVCPNHHNNLHEYKRKTTNNIIMGPIAKKRIVRKDTKPKPKKKTVKKSTRRTTGKKSKTPYSDYFLI